MGYFVWQTIDLHAAFKATLEMDLWFETDRGDVNRHVTKRRSDGDLSFVAVF